MAIEYTWQFRSFDTAPTEGDLVDVVKTIHWGIIGVDGEFYANIYGTIDLDAADPNSFVAFNDITEEWAIAVTSDKIDVNAAQSNISDRIAEQKNPSRVNKSPPF